METYKQPIKSKARRFSLQAAVSALTENRKSSAIITTDEFDGITEYASDYLLRSGYVTPDFRRNLSPIASEWHDFHTATVGYRKPSELKALYLSGPEPWNDLSVLLELGLIPPNIWAIESNEENYRQALAQLRSKGSFIRVHHGTLESFFETSNEQFDLIYIDACGALPSNKPNTLNIPLALFCRERLAPLGSLITNFAQPPEEKRDIYELVFSYFFSPRYADCPSALTDNGADPAVAAADPNHLKFFMKDCFDEVYSDFITRFLVELGREIVPLARIFGNQDLRRKYFSPKTQVRDAIENAQRVPRKLLPEETAESFWKRFFRELGDVHLNPGAYPAHTFLSRAARDKKVSSILGPIENKCRIGGQSLRESFLATTLLSHIVEGHIDIASDDMKTALASSWYDADGGIFCDVPLPNLLVNSLFGIYGHPYFPNSRVSERLSYTAKKTKMYTDVLILDQCRYYFDFLPTIDLIRSRFRSLEYQIVLRICLDRMGRHDFASSSHPFKGSALAGLGEHESATFYDFGERRAFSI